MSETRMATACGAFRVETSAGIPALIPICWHHTWKRRHDCPDRRRESLGVLCCSNSSAPSLTLCGHNAFLSSPLVALLSSKQNAKGDNNCLCPPAGGRTDCHCATMQRMGKTVSLSSCVGGEQSVNLLRGRLSVTLHLYPSAGGRERLSMEPLSVRISGGLEHSATGTLPVL
ncbi:hypothetical protein FKM82_016726 [Ascaphus truei]